MYSLILHGRKRLVDLQNWRVSVNLVQTAASFSSASAAADVSHRGGRKGKSFTVDTMGLTSKLSSEAKGNQDSVLNLLRSHGFTDSQVSSIITSYPSLLLLDADKSIGPKLQFLKSRGASNSEFTEVISTVPKILGKTGDKTVSVYYDFVKEVIEADKSSKLEKLCLSSLQHGSKQENKIRNLSALRDLGVPQRILFPLLISHCACICGKERFQEALKKVVEMGFDPTTPRFVQALQAVYVISDKAREEKVQLYKSLGFDVEDVWDMFKKWPPFLVSSEKKILTSMETFQGLGFSRGEFVMMATRYPQCIGCFGETLKNKTEFLVKKMNWPLKAVVSYPPVLGMSLENRAVPRCNVIKTLMSKGLLESDEPPPIGSVFACSDEVFLQRYVRKYDNEELVDELMAIFSQCRVS